VRALLALFNRMTDIDITVHARYTGTGKFPSVFSGIRTYILGFCTSGHADLSK
jgi:hypothetical protein